MKRFLYALSFLLFILLSSACAQENAAPVKRALLVSCDHFLTVPDTGSAARNNAEALQSCLSAGTVQTTLSADTVSGADTLRELIQNTFYEAEDGDISYLYISTHGIYSPARINLTASLVFSDGMTEGRVSVAALYNMLKSVHGQKIVILDACSSGAFIGQGLSDFESVNLFDDPTFSVITSAGAQENSWYWQGARKTQGMSCFASILCAGISPDTGFAADTDADGQITFPEIREYMMQHLGSSTAHFSVTSANNVFFEYDPSVQDEPSAPLFDLSFDQTVLSADEPTLSFSYFLTRPCEVIYRLTAEKNGEWDFMNDLVSLQESTAGFKDGSIMLTLDDEDESSCGYVLLQIFTREESKLSLCAEQLICVPPLGGDIALQIETPSEFDPALIGEMPLIVRHDTPCVLTVSVISEGGQTVRVIREGIATRPEHLTPEGSFLWWDGLDDAGSPAPGGAYRIRVEAETGLKKVIRLSDPFTLIMQNTP